jgi:hypothetical protein
MDKIHHIIQNNPHLIQDARDWAKDSLWEETDEDPSNDFINDIPVERLFKLINKNYDGGLSAFIEDNKRVKLSHKDNHEHNTIKWHDRQAIYNELLDNLRNDMRCPDCGERLIEKEIINGMGHELIIAYCTNCGFQESLIEKAEHLMDKNANTILHKLASIANELDVFGFQKEANYVDEVLVKLAKYNAPREGKKKKRWSVKYKKSINCSDPKGFSQKQYCNRKRSGGGYKS